MDLKLLSGAQEKLNRRMRFYFDTYFSNTSLTSTQALALEFIMLKGQEEDVLPKDLENFLEIKGSSVNSLLNGLERNGYLRRESVAYDGRYKKLIPTQKALDMQEDISARINHYLETIYGGIGEEDLEVFYSVLERMIQNMA